MDVQYVSRRVLSSSGLSVFAFSFSSLDSLSLALSCIPLHLLHWRLSNGSIITMDVYT
jgi:hypothetical protein